MPDDRGPSAVTIERVMAAWQRTRDGLAADEMLASDEAMVTVEMTTEAELDVDTVLKRIVTAMLFASLRETEAGKQEKAMQARKARYKTRKELLRRELLDILLETKRRRFVAPEGTVGTKRIPGSVVITDEELIPDEYVTEKVVRTPNKEALHADLAEGVVIAGAAMSNGGWGLTWRPQRGADDTAATVEE